MILSVTKVSSASLTTLCSLSLVFFFPLFSFLFSFLLLLKIIGPAPIPSPSEFVSYARMKTRNGTGRWPIFFFSFFLFSFLSFCFFSHLTTYSRSTVVTEKQKAKADRVGTHKVTTTFIRSDTEILFVRKKHVIYHSLSVQVQCHPAAIHVGSHQTPSMYQDQKKRITKRRKNRVAPGPVLSQP
jgi:hypothetical protein